MRQTFPSFHFDLALNDPEGSYSDDVDAGKLRGLIFKFSVIRETAGLGRPFSR